MKQESLTCPTGKSLFLNRLSKQVADLQEEPYIKLASGQFAGHSIGLVVTNECIGKQPILCPDCPAQPAGCNFTYGTKS